MKRSQTVGHNLSHSTQWVDFNLVQQKQIGMCITFYAIFKNTFSGWDSIKIVQVSESCFDRTQKVKQAEIRSKNNILN